MRIAQISSEANGLQSAGTCAPAQSVRDCSVTQLGAMHAWALINLAPRKGRSVASSLNPWPGLLFVFTYSDR